MLIDLGAVERIDARLRGALGAAVVELATRDARVTIDRARLEGELVKLVDDTSSGADGAKLMGQMVAISRTHALRMPPALLGLARSLAILDGVLRALDPAADLVRDLRRELAPATWPARDASVALHVPAWRSLFGRSPPPIGRADLVRVDARERPCPEARARSTLARNRDGKLAGSLRECSIGRPPMWKGRSCSPSSRTP